MVDCFKLRSVLRSRLVFPIELSNTVLHQAPASEPEQLTKVLKAALV
jgi:hypothetical protein